jgi:hypothetical protein
MLLLATLQRRWSSWGRGARSKSEHEREGEGGGGREGVRRRESDRKCQTEGERERRLRHTTHTPLACRERESDREKQTEREREHLGIPLILLARDIERESDLAQKLYFKAIQHGKIHPSHVRPLCKKERV